MSYRIECKKAQQKDVIVVAKKNSLQFPFFFRFFLTWSCIVHYEIWLSAMWHELKRFLCRTYFSSKFPPIHCMHVRNPFLYSFKIEKHRLKAFNDVVLYASLPLYITFVAQKAFWHAKANRKRQSMSENVFPVTFTKLCLYSACICRLLLINFKIVYMCLVYQIK